LKNYKRALVVEGEFNETNKTTRPSEGSGVPRKGKKMTRNFKKTIKGPDRAGTVRDYRFAYLPGSRKLSGILIGVPVVRREFDAPETRARREKFNSDTPAFVRGIAQGDNSTCLLFFGGKIGEDNVGADFHWLVQEKQTAMRVYHDRFAVLAEVLAVGVLARSAHGYAYPESQAAPLGPDRYFRHDPRYRAGWAKLSQ